MGSVQREPSWRVPPAVVPFWPSKLSEWSAQNLDFRAQTLFQHSFVQQMDCSEQLAFHTVHLQLQTKPATVADFLALVQEPERFEMFLSASSLPGILLGGVFPACLWYQSRSVGISASQNKAGSDLEESHIDNTRNKPASCFLLTQQSWRQPDLY